MARRLDHRRGLSQQELQLREEQGETTSVDTPEGDEGSRGRRRHYMWRVGVAAVCVCVASELTLA